MDIKHLQFSFRMYWANMKGLLNMVAEGIILVASLASLFILVYQFGFKYSAHVTHMLETSRVLPPAGFLYRDIAPVYFEIQRDHTRENVIPGYRHLFFPLCRAIGQSILQRSHSPVAALPRFPHGTAVRLFPPAVAERHPFVAADIHAVTKPYQAVPPVPAEFRVRHPCRFGIADVAKRHGARDSFRRCPVHLDHLRLCDRTDDSRCGNDIHAYRTYHHHVSYPDRRYRSHDFHQLFRPFFHGAFIFHQQARSERHAERRPGETGCSG